MDKSKYSQRAIETISLANKAALSYGNVEVSDLHLFYCLLKVDDNRIISYIKKMGANKEKLLLDLENAISKLKSPKGVTNLYLARSYQRVLLVSEEICRNLYDSKIDIYHIFLALLKETDTASAKIGLNHNLSYDSLLDFISTSFNQDLLDGISNESLLRLEKYGRNLTKEAYEGNLDPLIGREDEIESAIRILSRRIKNNPILIGEAGVGKTAIVEGLVQKIAADEVPDKLKNKIVISLDMASLVAGTKYRGDFEDRLRKILDIIKESCGKIILFIDEIHNIIGAGNTSGAMDTANILKPMLARGEILTIGATTIDEYKKHIEKDAALDRRFQKILVEEPSVEKSIEILKGIRPSYQVHHKVYISDEAINDAVKLSKRFLSYRKLPDVAIDVMDEAAAIAKMKLDKMPAEIDNLSKELISLESKRMDLEKSAKSESLENLKQIKEKIDGISKSRKKKVSLYEKEKDRLESILLSKNSLEAVEKDIEKAQKSYDIEKLEDLLISKKILDEKLALLEEKPSYYPLDNRVTSKEVKLVVSKLSGMPAFKLEINKLESLENIRGAMKDEFVGDPLIIDKIINAYMVSESGLFNQNKAIGSFLIRGNSRQMGYLAELTSKYLFDGETSLIRYDMEEFSDKSSITKLLGAPPGYVGYDDGGSLTEAIRIKPYRVLVFSNIEKAHKQIQALISQMLSQGRLKDNKARMIDLTNTMIFISNSSNDDISQIKNAVDDVFIIDDLDSKKRNKLIKIRLNKLKDNLKESKIDICWDDEFVRQMTALANKYQMDSQEIEKYIKEELYYLISKEILEDKTNKKMSLAIKDEKLELIIDK